MEAVPKLSFLSFELKISPENTHFGPKLKQYIAEAYREDPESYNNEIHQLEGLRSAAVRPTIDGAGLQALNKYFCQLRAMQSRFPMAKGQPAACSFAWKDLYAHMNGSLSDVRFELACILYNIGALHTQLASQESRSSADSLKAACQHFQNAAWAFQYLRDQYPQPSGVDVSSEILKLLQEICFAQAQECILDKSRQDTRKSSVIGAVATQVLHFYKNSLAILGPSTGSDNIHEIIGTKLYNNWYRYLSFKAYYIGCIVALYQGINAEEQQKMGERVAFYQQAVDKLNEARKLAKYIEPVQVTQEALTFTNDIVEGKRKAAKNENEFIYHEEVPEKDMLTELKPVCLVKAIPINFNDPEVFGQDIFSRLVPMGAHETSSLYSEEKAKLLRHVVSQVEAKNVELTEFMSSLQLDQLDVLDSEQKIPQEIVDRCAAMNAKTEMITTLVDSMNSLAQVISDVEHSLAEIKADIQEEIQLEKEHGAAVGPRGPSLVQTELARELQKYSDAHHRTSDSNQVLHKAMTLHIANLRLLALPLEALQEKIPSVDNIEGLDRGCMAEMRRVVRRARDMRQQRAELLAALRAALAADDVTPKLLADPAAAAAPAPLFRAELDKHTPQVKIIEQNLAAQENIINRLTALYAAYGESRRLLADALRKRDAVINALMTSYDSWGELVGKSRKGLEFYRKLQASLAALHARLRATRQVQRDERSLHDQPAAAPAVPAAPAAPAPKPGVPASAAPKLKDYLPYMKNRSLARNAPPQVAPVEVPPPEAFYPDNIYPTSVRPAPVGSEDIPQANVPDGLTGNMAGYMRYAPYVTSDSDPYAAPKPAYLAGPAPAGSAPAPDAHAYSYAAPQHVAVPDQHQLGYGTPYQTFPQTGPSADSLNTPTPGPDAAPGGYPGPHAAPGGYPGPLAPPTDADATPYRVNQDLSSNFSQLSVGPGAEPARYADYSQTYFSVHYPPSASNVATYSSAAQNIDTSSTQFSAGSSVNYPYTPDGTPYPQPSRSNPAPEAPDSYASYQTSQAGYPPAIAPASNGYRSFHSIPNASSVYSPTSDHRSSYTHTSNTDTYACTNAANPGMNMASASDGYVNACASYPGATDPYAAGYGYPPAPPYAPAPAPEPTPAPDPALARLDALDRPIRSHAKGEALSVGPMSSYQSFESSAAAYLAHGVIQPQNSMNYASDPAAETQSQPPASISYVPEHSVAAGGAVGAGGAGGASSYQQHPGYTYNPCTGNYDYSYGSQNASYYSQPAGPAEQPGWGPAPGAPGAPDGTYVQSGQAAPGTTVTYSTEVSVSKVIYTDPSPPVLSNEPAPSRDPEPQAAPAFLPHEPEVPHEPHVTRVPHEPHEPQVPQEPREPEPKEPTAFDLLSDIDFSVEQKPLMPEIKVPPISANAIFKPTTPRKEEATTPAPKEEATERPPPRDLFADPALLNRFTQDVKNLQKLVDSLENKLPSGQTVLEAKWQYLLDQRAHESAGPAQRTGRGRLALLSDANVYIDASYYKQLSPWCMPLVMSTRPDESDAETFWRAMFENNIGCIICLQTETEMRGASCWPGEGREAGRAGAVRVAAGGARALPHCTERRLVLSSGTAELPLAHYQIHVFPDRVSSAALVQLCDAAWRAAQGAGAGAGAGAGQLRGVCVQGGAGAEGAGRGALLGAALLALSDVRAGRHDAAPLAELVERTFVSLAAGAGAGAGARAGGARRLGDALRTVLFYVQGVLCSGTTMFNGEAVSVPSGAAVLPPAPGVGGASATKSKFSRESFEEMRQAPGLTSGDMRDPLNFLDPLWSLKKK